jgi:hypothetical protein
VWTNVYRGSEKLTSESVRNLYRNDAPASRLYGRGKVLQPLGPLVSLAGVALSYVAIKGKPASEVVVYRNDYFTVNYTKRSRPLFFGGLGLFAGGIVLVELSEEFINRSVMQYNMQLRSRQSGIARPTLHFGVTPSAGIGVYARF